MDQPRLYRLRPGAVGLTRAQLVVVVIGVAVAVAGFVALALRAWGPAAIMLGLAAMTIGLTTLIAHTNTTPPPT